MILDLTSRLFYVVLFCTMNGLWVLGISSAIWCGLYVFGQSKGVKKFLFHLSKEDLFPHFIQIWTRSFKIILLKERYIYIYIYIGLYMLYNQEKCSNNWTSIYEVCLFVTLWSPKPWCLFCHALGNVGKHLWWVGVHQVGFIKFLTNGEKIIEYWTIVYFEKNY